MKPYLKRVTALLLAISIVLISAPRRSSAAIVVRSVPNYNLGFTYDSGNKYDASGYNWYNYNCTANATLYVNVVEEGGTYYIRGTLNWSVVMYQANGGSGFWIMNQDSGIYCRNQIYINGTNVLNLNATGTNTAIPWNLWGNPATSYQHKSSGTVNINISAGSTIPATIAIRRNYSAGWPNAPSSSTCPGTDYYTWNTSSDTTAPYIVPDGKRYLYDKYNTLLQYKENASWTYQGMLGSDTYVNGYTSMSFNQATGGYTFRGNLSDPNSTSSGNYYPGMGYWDYTKSPSVYRVLPYGFTVYSYRYNPNLSLTMYRQGTGYYGEPVWYYYTMTPRITSYRIRGSSLVQGGIVAYDGTYPNDGLHTDNYWYMKIGLANTAPTLTLSSPAAGSAFFREAGVSGITVTGTVKDDENDDLLVTASFDNGVEKTLTATGTASGQIFSFAFDTLEDGLETGDRTLTVKVSDGRGGTASIVRNITITTRITRDSYLLLYETVQYRTSYYDEEGDPEVSRQYKYLHDPDVFENNLGTISDSGQWRSQPYASFDKTGGYEAVFRVQDMPYADPASAPFWYWSDETSEKLVFYVHRKPIAGFSAGISGQTASGYNLYPIDNSYDMDHMSLLSRGISDVTYQWQDAFGGVWKEGFPNSIPFNATYRIRQRVRDVDGPGGAGAWSDYFYYLLNASSLPPSLEANPSTRDWANYDISVTISVTDPNNDYSGTSYKWARDLLKPGDGWLSSTAAGFTLSQPDEGDWYLHLEAMDRAGNRTYRALGPYRLDGTAPVISPDKDGGRFNDGFSLTVSITDAGGSGLESMEYAWSTDASMPSEGWNTTIISDTFGLGRHEEILSREEEKTWYLHVKASDFAGNTAYGCFGQYTLTLLRLQNLRITGIADPDWQTLFRDGQGGETALSLDGISVTDMPVYSNTEGNNIKLGYMVWFELDSKGLHGEGDRVEITADFFAMDGNGNLQGADLYVEEENGRYTLLELGSYAGISKSPVLTGLHRGPSEQKPDDPGQNTWRFEYFIPATAKAVLTGTGAPQDPENMLEGRLLAVFSIVGITSGEEFFDYTMEETLWGLSDGGAYGHSLPSGFDLLGKGEGHGEIVWFDLDKTVLDDLEIQRRW